MMKYYLHAWAIVAAMVLCGTSAQAQYLGIGLGRSFGDDLGAAAGGVPGALNPLSAGIREGNTLVLEAGANYLRFLRTGIHYNYSRPEGFLRRGDAFGSRAELQLRAHTLTFDLGLRTPQWSGFRLYGAGGLGAGRFNVEVTQQVETPFPGGPPDNVVVPVIAYGVGVEHEFLPGVRWKAEVRNERTSAPEDFFRPGGHWNRVLVSGGIVLGR
jgi:hypothetical protein